MDAYSIVLKVIMALGGLGLFLIGMKNMGEALNLQQVANFVIC